MDQEQVKGLLEEAEANAVFETAPWCSLSSQQDSLQPLLLGKAGKGDIHHIYTELLKALYYQALLW